MRDADHTAGLPPQPDPPQDRPTKPVPPNIAALLVIVRILLGYGRHLANTLERRAAGRGFATIAQFFGTARLPAIQARLARGLLRAMALEQVLLARAARGRDLVFYTRRDPDDRPPQPAHAQPALQAAAPPPPRPARRPAPDEPPDPANLPTLEQLTAYIRRRPVGHAIADICRDLGVAPTLCDGILWNALYEAITWYRGSFLRYYRDMRKRRVAYADEWDRDTTHAFDWPAETRDGVRGALGFFIGEPGATPLSPPALAPAAAARPP